jgi:type II secretory pathway pseudopilin PulG
MASRLAAADQRIGCWLRNRHRQRRSVGFYRRYGDNGFVLLETLVAISLISVVMAAFTTFFVNTVAFTSQQRATQIATLIANSAVEMVRAAPPSDLLVSGATAGVPATQTVNNVVYGVTASFVACAIQTGVPVNGVTLNPSCLPAATGIQYLRAVVTVTWTGARCPPTKCQYVTSTLVSPVDDPLFNLNQSAPAVPVLNSPGAQISAVGDSISLPAIFTAVPTALFAITGPLPAGLVLNTATGVISGIPTAVTATSALTMLLTDGFGRIATTSFTWTVGPGLTATTPANQASVRGVAITTLVVSAAGGTLGYTWSDPGLTLPAGFTLSTVNNQATITGTPTGVGAFPAPFAVSLTVTDSKARTAIVSFPWVVSYPPIAATNPGSQTSTVGTPDGVTPLSVTGGSGTVVWSSATLPAGITLTTAGVLAGTPTTAGVTSVTLLVVDTQAAAQQTVQFTWTVYDKPTVTSPGNLSWTVGQTVTLPLTTTCPNVPCTYAMNNGPATFVISTSGVLTGTVTSAPQTFNAVTFRVQDSSGATATTAPFAVTVNPAPTVVSPGNQTTTLGTAVSLNVAASGGTAPLTYSAANLPSGLTLNTSTGLIAGTPTTAGTTAGVVVTVTDVRGVSAFTTFNWTVVGVPSAPLAVVVVNGDGKVTPTWTAPTTGTVTSYAATLSPGGAACTIAGLSCVISGLTNGVVYSLTVTATNGSGTGPASTAVTAIPYPAVMLATNSNLTLWLDGADPAVKFSDSSSACTGTVATTATTIGCWKDKSAVGENFIQTVDVNRPGIATWNGLPAANFVDTTDVLNSIRTTNQYQTVFVAANITNGTNGVQGVYVDLFGQGNNQDYDVRVGSGVGRSSATPPNVNDWSFNSTNTGWQFEWANGVQGANVSLPLAVITSDQSPVVNSFAANVSNTFMSRGVVGQIGDVITFKTALTPADRHSVEQYLSNKWAVPITPAMVPQAPVAVVGVASGPNGAAVSWAAPRFNGGATISGYTVTSSPGSMTCITTGALSCTVSGLTTGTYTFTVTATNSVGAGPASSPSPPMAR